MKHEIDECSALVSSLSYAVLMHNYKHEAHTQKHNIRLQQKEARDSDDKNC